jgi:hypothetical protein
MTLSLDGELKIIFYINDGTMIEIEVNSLSTITK